MKEHIRILNKIKDEPYGVLENDINYKKLLAAINKSIKLLQTPVIIFDDGHIAVIKSVNEDGTVTCIESNNK